jgi:formylmethanofuran dehydrogenase subunit C
MSPHSFLRRLLCSQLTSYPKIGPQVILSSHVACRRILTIASLTRELLFVPLRLRYRATTSIPVEVEGLLPSAVRAKSVAEIEKWQVHLGNQQLPLADFFKVSGDASDNRMEFEGNLSGVHWIGAHLSEGTIHVNGEAGRHVGSEMSGGEIHVSGNAGDWVGGEMHGGLIHVRGSAGNQIGAAYRGSPKGMTGGTILIGGDAGNECGLNMRRGLLAVGGSIGAYAALNMIAGSVFVFGSCGTRPAAGMRRGTLALFAPNPPKLLPTFKLAGSCRPQFLGLYFHALRRHGFSVPDELFGSDYRLYHGDLVGIGRGEVLVREQ